MQTNEVCLLLNTDPGWKNGLIAFSAKLPNRDLMDNIFVNTSNIQEQIISSSNIPDTLGKTFFYCFCFFESGTEMENISEPPKDLIVIILPPRCMVPANPISKAYTSLPDLYKNGLIIR
jgi:hypothetical protein